MTLPDKSRDRCGLTSRPQRGTPFLRLTVSQVKPPLEPKRGSDRQPKEATPGEGRDEKTV